MNTNTLRELRIELGQTQDEVTTRALASPLVRPTFSRSMIAKAEGRAPDELRSHFVRVALAIGLGLTMEDFELYMAGARSLAETIPRSSIKPDPYAVARIRDADTRRGPRGHAEGDGPSDALALVIRVGEAAQLPAEFLREFEQEARERGEVRPAFEWVDEMRAQAGVWKRRQLAAARESRTAESAPTRRRKDVLEG